MLHGGEGGERCVGISAFMMLPGGRGESSPRGGEGSGSFRFRISRGNIYTVAMAHSLFMQWLFIDGVRRVRAQPSGTPLPLARCRAWGGPAGLLPQICSCSFGRKLLAGAVIWAQAAGRLTRGWGGCKSACDFVPVGRCPGEAPGRQQRCSSVGMQPRCCNVCRLLRVHITHPRCPSRAAWRQRETRADYRFSRCAGGRVYVIPRAPPKPTHGPAPLLSAVGISAVCGRVGDPSRSAHYFPTTGAACITGGTRAAAAHSPEPGGHRHRRGSVLQRRRRVWVSLNRCSSRLGKFRGRGARGAARSGSSFKPTGLPPPGSAGGARAADVPGARGSPARGGGSGHALPPRLPRRCLFAS